MNFQYEYLYEIDAILENVSSFSIRGPDGLF